MSNQIQLLRMLEPAVRPGNTPAPVAPVHTPEDQRDFQSLLDTASDQTDTDSNAAPINATDQPDQSQHGDSSLNTLHDVGLIENESLRRLLSAYQSPAALNDQTP